MDPLRIINPIRQPLSNIYLLKRAGNNCIRDFSCRDKRRWPTRPGGCIRCLKYHGLPSTSLCTST
uniref:Uncharacterized protein n=1 Tax=Romanomermis culicivorax TaxID=13658 RepID=A0A915K4M8_ROMCU